MQKRRKNHKSLFLLSMQEYLSPLRSVRSWWVTLTSHQKSFILRTSGYEKRLLSLSSLRSNGRPFISTSKRFFTGRVHVAVMHIQGARVQPVRRFGSTVCSEMPQTAIRHDSSQPVYFRFRKYRHYYQLLQRLLVYFRQKIHHRAIPEKKRGNRQNYVSRKNFH